MVSLKALLSPYYWGGVALGAARIPFNKSEKVGEILPKMAGNFFFLVFCCCLFGDAVMLQGLCPVYRGIAMYSSHLDTGCASVG